MDRNYTIGSTLTWLESFLDKAGDDNPRLSAQLLMSEALGMDRAKLYLNLDRVIDEKCSYKIRDWSKRRANNEPIQYIIGHTYFHNLKLNVCPGVLIPRPETEVLVEECIKYLKIRSVIHDGGLKRDNVSYCVDLCTGTGCIPIAIVKQYKNAKFLATDISDDALRCANHNAQRYNLQNKINFLQGDLERPIIQNWLNSKGKIDLVVSNPPYVPTKELQDLPLEVSKYEPRAALDGGNDGLDFYRRILHYSKNALRKGGMVAVELHETKLNVAKKIAAEYGFYSVNIVNDLTYRPRVLTAIKKS